ncbi:MAG: hypothetical protein VKM97_03875 [Cyanobacteriota bacterium]|nr:hypothetical protein [Cyanobacteriota bacterium]
MQSAFDDLFQTQTSDSQQHQASTDPVEAYFTCITSCSLEDGECVTRCVEELRDTH